MTPGDCTGTLAAPSRGVWDWPELRVDKRILPNGLRVVLAESHAAPFVWLGWVSPAGSARDTPELAGLAALTPLLLREGTARRTARQVTTEVEAWGAHLAVSCDWDSASISLELLSCDLAAGAELLFDMACRAEFSHDAVARLCQRRLGELERRRRQPAALADDAFARALYGDGTYGRSPLGTAASLQRIEAADVAAFHATHYRPAASQVVLAGSFDGERAADLLASFELPSPGFPSVAPPAAFAPPVEPTAGVRLLDFPHAAQTELRVGHASVAFDSPDLPALQLLAEVLGGGPCSRLAGSLRQRLGLTYHVRSRFVVRQNGGPFVVETRVASGAAGVALAAIAREIERLCAECVPADELGQAQRRLLGMELRRFQYSFDAGGALGQVAFEADAVAHFERKRRAIAAVEPDTLRELARRHLHPERLVAVAVGPAEALRRHFSENGTVAPAPRSGRSEIVGGGSPGRDIPR